MAAKDSNYLFQKEMDKLVMLYHFYSAFYTPFAVFSHAYFARYNPHYSKNRITSQKNNYITFAFT